MDNKISVCKESNRLVAMGPEETSRMIKIFCILIGVVITLVYTCIKTGTLKIYTFY